MSRQSRKLEHINLAVQSQELATESHFRDLRFVHDSLPETDLSQMSLATSVAGKTWQTPLYINAMTGGAAGTEDVNGPLAEIASEYGLAMAVGSERSGVKDAAVVHTYRVVRDKMTDGIVLANIGADVNVNEAMQAVDMLEANYLQLHLNTVQEVVMPEGDRSFTGTLQNINQIVRASSVPVIIKEVGFGMSMELYTRLIDIGVSVVDVGGRGGTNFAWIENQRRDRGDMNYFAQWGQTTLESLLEAQSFAGRLEWMASGGVRSPLDAAKCLALGAKSVGAAGVLLRVLKSDGQEAVAQLVRDWLYGLQSIMAVVGATNIDEMRQAPVVVGGETANWCRQRGIATEDLARRGRH